ncbi:MAG TPA: NAD(P)-dependent oxidoreductase [Gemmatimonadales bacterium]|nr:NAD(P)-dependent oxidoreductase [Gemmatimonadales bacterium]
MRALVTGATGFVGSHLLDALVEAGTELTALVRTPRAATGLLARGIRLVEGDLDDPGTLRSAAAGQDVIYHCAGVIAARSSAEFMQVNRDGTARLVEAAADVSRARVIFVSSLAGVGPCARGGRRQGDEPPEPVSAYGRSKLAGEQAVRAGPLPWTIVRPPAVYGPRDTAFLRTFRMLGYGVGAVFGDGAQELSLVYAGDLARALAAVGRCDTAAGRVFYPCHPEVVTSTALIESIALAMRATRADGGGVGRGAARVRVVKVSRWLAAGVLGVTAAAARLRGSATILNPDKAVELFAPAWTADPDPLTAATGWRAEHDLTSGLAKTAAWYREAGWLP